MLLPLIIRKKGTFEIPHTTTHTTTTTTTATVFFNENEKTLIDAHESCCIITCLSSKHSMSLTHTCIQHRVRQASSIAYKHLV
jgi:hypothetical protein